MTDEQEQKQPLTSGLGPAGRDIVAIFEAKATENGLELDADDVVILDQAARVADLIADLDADIATNGVMLAGASGASKVNPAVTESRQQRVVLGRLLSDVDKRLGVGGGGFRGTYAGDGSPNQLRNGLRAEGVVVPHGRLVQNRHRSRGGA